MTINDFLNKLVKAFKTCGWCKREFSTTRGRKVHEAKHKRNKEQQPGLSLRS